MTNGRCDHCGEMPGVEFLQAWMHTPNPMLGNITPLEMMKAGRGDNLARFIETAYELNQGPSGDCCHCGEDH